MPNFFEPWLKRYITAALPLSVDVSKSFGGTWGNYDLDAGSVKEALLISS